MTSQKYDVINPVRKFIQYPVRKFINWFFWGVIRDRTKNIK
jgi:hypothetical protein